MDDTMKAWQYNQYGGIDTLQWADTPMPVPAAGQVLVQVKAASLNPTDQKIREGILKFPGAGPFPRVMGMDFAGIVTRVGEGVSHLREGDKVMGFSGLQGGAFAQYTLGNADNTFLMPDNLSFEQATTLPMNAATGLKVVNNYLKPAAGKAILVNGAAGGIGLFVVQFLKNADALVTGTARGEASLNILKSLGVDAVNYTTTNILQSGKTFDTILDMSGKLDFEQAKDILKDGGEFATMVPKGNPQTTPGRTDGSKKERLVHAVPGPDEFKTSQALAGEGKIRAFVGARFPMQEAKTALQQFESGQSTAPGKVVLVA